MCYLKPPSPSPLYTKEKVSKTITSKKKKKNPTDKEGDLVARI